MSEYSTIRIHNTLKAFVLRWTHPLKETTQEKMLVKMALVLDELGEEKVTKMYDKKVEKRFNQLIKEWGLQDKRFKENKKE